MMGENATSKANVEHLDQSMNANKHANPIVMILMVVTYSFKDWLLNN
jgi:hypothetical protein